MEITDAAVTAGTVVGGEMGQAESTEPSTQQEAISQLQESIKQLDARVLATKTRSDDHLSCIRPPQLRFSQKAPTGEADTTFASRFLAFPPVLGQVSSTSARLLVEAALTTEIVVSTATATGTIARQQFTKACIAHQPVVISMNGLQPGQQYEVEVASGLQGAIASTLTFRTATDDGLRFEHTRVHFFDPQLMHSSGNSGHTLDVDEDEPPALIFAVAVRPLVRRNQRAASSRLICVQVDGYSFARRFVLQAALTSLQSHTSTIADRHGVLLERALRDAYRTAFRNPALQSVSTQFIYMRVLNNASSSRHYKGRRL